MQTPEVGQDLFPSIQNIYVDFTCRGHRLADEKSIDLASLPPTAEDKSTIACPDRLDSQ